MPPVEKLAIAPPNAQVDVIDALVRTGAVEVLGADSPAARESDEAVERWLRDAVVPTYDAMRADARRGLTAEQVKAAMRAHHASHVKTSGRGA